jgi:glycosyltransferase involved in cell wall biosynthesis
MTRYVIITPVRDEEKYIAATIDSVCNQTVRPSEWVIVNDGSIDRTGQIIDYYAAQHSWIRAVHRHNRGFRKSGAGVVEAFYDGYTLLQSDDWQFIVKLDGDLTFGPNYFEQCFTRFSSEVRLGIGGGDIYQNINDELKLEANPKFHVRGATKIYRRACWDAIGGLWVAPGWDTIDEVKANMLGWQTHAFPDLQLVHHRVTGSADGFVRDRIKHGVACYISGYHPLFLAASCLRRLVRPPYVVGAFAVLFGFLKGYVSKTSRVNDSQLISYVRNQQLRRLCGLQSIWK